MGKYTIKTIFTISLLLMIFIIVYFSSIPSTIIKYKFKNITISQFFVPQGWAFFTRKPIEAQYILYKVNNIGCIERQKTNHSELENILGLDRRMSFLTYELSSIGYSV